MHTDLGCMKVFTSVMSGINSIYIWCVFSLFSATMTGDGEEREIKKVRMKKLREREREVTALGI